MLSILILLILQARTSALTLNPVVAGRSHLAIHDGPDFLGEVLSELAGVSDDDDTALKRLESLRQGTQGVAVEVVGGLVEDNDVGTLPRASGKNALDTLSTRQPPHSRVGDELRVQAKLGAVLFDLLADQGTELTAGEGLLLIDLGNHLGVGLHDLVARNPGVVAGHHGGPLLALHADVLTERERALVLVGVLELSARVDADDTTGGALDLVDLVHGLLVLVGDDLVGTVHGLAVLTGLETPLDVLGGGLVEVVINVGEGVLLDVGDTDVLVLVDLTLGGDQFTSEDIDQGGFTGTVGTDDGNTGAKGDLEGDVADLGLGSSRILEGHVGAADDRLGLGLDAFEETGLGELELHVASAELIVGTSGRDLLDELAESTTVTLELEAFVVDDVLNHIVQEAAVVGNHDGSARGGAEVVLQPGDVLDIKMVGGLVEQKDVGFLEHGTGKGKLHLPATREGGDGALKLLLEETELVELGLDFVALGIKTDLSELLHGPANNSLLSIGRVEVVLDVDGLDLALLGEALELLVVDGTHEGGLAGTVGAEKTVALATLQAKVSLVEQDLGTVSQTEGAVAKVLSLFLVGRDVLILSGTGGGTLAELLSDTLGISLANDGGDVGKGILSPDGDLAVLLIDELTGDGTNVVDDSLSLSSLGLVLGLENLLEDTCDGGDVTSGGDLGDLAVLDITDANQGVQTLASLLTSLRVGKSVVVLLEGGHQLGQERSDNLGVLDELAHVVDNDSGLTLDGSLTLNETTVKQGDHDGQGGAGDIGNESGGTQEMDGLRDVLRLGDTLDELGNETLNILVDDELADLLHGGVGSLLDLRLGVPHGLADGGDQVRHTVAELSGGGDNERVDAVEGSHLLGPLLGVTQRVEDGGEDGLDGVSVGRLDDRGGGSLSGVLHRDHLVTDGREDSAQEADEVRLDAGGDSSVGSNSADGLQSTLTGESILLVAELLLERLDRLEGEGLFGDGTGEQRGDVAGGSGGLVLSGGDVQILDHVLQDGNRLGRLLAGDSRDGTGVDGRHFGRNFDG